MRIDLSIQLVGFGVAGMVLLGCGDDGDSSSPLVSTQKLDFGQTDCGTVQVPRSVLLANPSSEAFTFTTAFATGSHYMVQPSAGFVLPGQQIELTVFSAPIPQTSATTENLFGDTLTITTDLDGDEPHAIAIEQTAHGAILELSTVTVPGTHVVGTSTTVPLTVRNVGNAPASAVAVTATGGFTFAPGSIATIAGGDEVAGTLTYLAGVQGAESSSLAVTAAAGPLCGPLPTAQATGNGSYAGAVPTKLVLVSGGQYSSSQIPTLFAVLPGGLVASLGSNDRGVRGAGSTIPSSASISLVRTADDHALDGVVDLAGGRSSACALRSNGSVYCWGNDSMTRAKDQVQPQPYAKPLVANGATAIAMSYGVRCIATNPGGVVSCTSAVNNVSTLSWKPTNATKLSIHMGGGYAIQPDGTVVSFGSNFHGERGNTSSSNSAPSPVTGLTNVIQTIAQSGRPSNNEKRGGCALKMDGTVWCWGSGRHGRLGSGSTADTEVPQQVMIDSETPLTGVTQISGAHGHRCAITATNVYCWGNGRYGKLGRVADDVNAYAQPTDEAIAGAVSIATTNRGTCVLQATGRITCFGNTPISAGDIATFDAFVAP